MTFSVKAVLALLIALVGFFPGPVVAQNIALQVQLCNDDAQAASVRIEACSVVIDSGRVPDVVPFLVLRSELYSSENMEEQSVQDYAEAEDLFENRRGSAYINALISCNNRALEALLRIEGCTHAIEEARASDLAPLLLRRGQLYFDEDMLAQGIEDFEEVLNNRSASSDSHYQAGVDLDGIGEYALATVHYDEAIRLNPRSANSYNNKAWILATASDGSIRDGLQAVAAATRAIELNDSGNYHDTLAASFAEVGDFERAVEEQEKAMEMSDEGASSYLQGAQERLELYRGGIPYRE